MRAIALGHAALAALLLGACSPAADDVRPEGDEHAAAAGDTASAHDHAQAAQDTGMHADHDAMALLPIMQRLASEMAAMQHALWTEDHAQVEAHAAAIAGHAHISEAELARIGAVLGTEMSAFEAADETVHQAALRMHAAARARDADAMLGHLAEVQRGCVACHERFRERLRTTATPAAAGT